MGKIEKQCYRNYKLTFLQWPNVCYKWTKKDEFKSLFFLITLTSQPIVSIFNFNWQNNCCIQYRGSLRRRGVSPVTLYFVLGPSTSLHEDYPSSVPTESYIFTRYSWNLRICNLTHYFHTLSCLCAGHIWNPPLWFFCVYNNCCQS